MKFILFVMVALFLLTTVSGIYVFVMACFRRNDQEWLNKEKLKKTPYGKYSDFIALSHQWLMDHNAQELNIKSTDGLKLHGLWVPAENPRGTILLVHGYRSTFLIDMGIAFELYYSRGFNLLIPQQRSHGKSQGRYITFGVKESEDMIQWIQYHNHTFGQMPMFLNGISMGASTVLYLADRILPANIRGIIADCGFTSPKDIISRVYKNVIRLPAVPTMWAVEFLARVFAGFSLQEKDTRKSLANSRLPVLLIHGKDDGFIPCEMTVEGYKACTAPKKMLLVDGAEHGVSFLYNIEGYTKMVDSFIDSNIGECL